MSSILKTPHVEEKFFAILKSGQEDLIPAYFGYWESFDEMIDKVFIFGHYFLEHYFREASPEFHRDLVRAFFSNYNRYIAAPRGFSKTTVLQLCCIFSIVNKLDKFIVIVEKTFTEAAEVIKGIKDEFVDNERLVKSYGYLIKNETVRIKTKYSKDIKDKDAQGDVFINGVRLRGKGFNSSIRGLKTRAWRPTRIICDDIEEDEHINNPEQRKKYENNYNKGIQPAADIRGTIKVFGTILHQDSLLNNLIENHGGKIFRAHDGDDPATAPEESFLWPARWSREKLIKKRKDMMSSGQSTNAYAQEYLNNPVSEKDRVFKFNFLWEMIPKPDDPSEKYRVPAQRITMKEFEDIRRKTTLNVYAMIDSADATTAGADWTGVVVVAVAPNGARFRLDVRREKRDIKGLIDLIFEVWEKWMPYGLIKIGVEKKAFNDQILPLFNDEKSRRTAYPIIEELKPMGRSKENRIRGALEGFYEMGKIVSVGTIDKEGIFRPVGDTNILLEELYDFPNAKHDDLSDAEAYGADIIVTPLADEEKYTPSREPQDDPFEAQNNYNTVGRYDDADPY